MNQSINSQEYLRNCHPMFVREVLQLAHNFHEKQIYDRALECLLFYIIILQFKNFFLILYVFQSLRSDWKQIDRCTRFMKLGVYIPAVEALYHRSCNGGFMLERTPHLFSISSLNKDKDNNLKIIIN